MAEQFSNKMELEVKEYWEKNNIPEKVRQKIGKNNYYFIDGPPYASGHLHLGTAMNRILKDLIIRYRRMTGNTVLDTPGFDTHGVPIEAKVQKAYGLKSKEDIEKFGIDKFTKECEKFATEHIEDMSREIYNLGQWMILRILIEHLTSHIWKHAGGFLKKQQIKGFYIMTNIQFMFVQHVRLQFLLMRLNIRI
jgi:isoleucyl-tRNA synthetase